MVSLRQSASEAEKQALQETPSSGPILETAVERVKASLWIVRMSFAKVSVLEASTRRFHLHKGQILAGYRLSQFEFLSMKSPNGDNERPTGSPSKLLY